MLTQLICSTVMVVITVAIHGAGLIALSRLLRLEAHQEAVSHVPAFSQRTLFATIGFVLGLFLLHGIEIWLYAGFYLAVGAINDLETAIFFSTHSYAAIGYGDSDIVRAWRVFAAIEGINGVLLIGWSTAFFVTMVARIGRG